MEKVSVIIPVYNSIKYLKKCVDSVCAQTYKNIEILIIDDGSTDGSGDLCDNLAGMDSRIRVIHKTNEGVSVARNIGINEATGNLICFADSDDYLEPEVLERLSSAMAALQSDIIMAGYKTVFVNEDETTCKVYTVLPPASPEIDQNAWLGCTGYIWNKMYRKDAIADIRFDTGISLYEDMLFNAKIIKTGKKMVSILYSGYHYVQHGSGSLGNIFRLDFFDLRERCFMAQADILRIYGISEKTIGIFLKKAEFEAVCSYIMRLARTKQLTKQGKKTILQNFLGYNRVKNIIRTGFVGLSVTDRIKKLLLKSHSISLILRAFS